LLDRDVAAGGFAVAAATANSRGCAGLQLLVVGNGWVAEYRAPQRVTA
jgi:hypothetical protein